MAYGRESLIILNNLAYQATEKSRLAKVEEAALYRIFKLSDIMLKECLGWVLKTFGVSVSHNV